MEIHAEFTQDSHSTIPQCHLISEVVSEGNRPESQWHVSAREG